MCQFTHSGGEQVSPDRDDGVQQGACLCVLLDVVRRIRAWDMLDVAADGAFWKRQLDEALAKAATPMIHGDLTFDPANAEEEGSE